MVDLVTLSSSQLYIISPYLGDYQVLHGVSGEIEVSSHWFICFVGLDVRSVAIEADVEGILRFTDILFSPLPQVH